MVITRESAWGVPVPLPGFGNKRFYVWFDALLAYYSAFKCSVGSSTPGLEDLAHEWWTATASRHHYFMGRDNRYFHEVIMNRIYVGLGDLRQRDELHVMGHLKSAGRKISRSRGNDHLVDEAIARYGPDRVRLDVLLSGLESGDADLLDQAGRGRSTAVLERWSAIVAWMRHMPGRMGRGGSFGLPSSGPARSLSGAIDASFETVGGLLDSGRFRDALEHVQSVVESAHALSQETDGRIELTDPELTQIRSAIRGLGTLLAPFAPDAALTVVSEKRRQILLQQMEGGAHQVGTSMWRRLRTDEEAEAG
jgi:methionyl-tRNA synthetase